MQKGYFSLSQLQPSGSTNEGCQLALPKVKLSFGRQLQRKKITEARGGHKVTHNFKGQLSETAEPKNLKTRSGTLISRPQNNRLSNNVVNSSYITIFATLPQVDRKTMKFSRNMGHKIEHLNGKVWQKFFYYQQS